MYGSLRNVQKSRNCTEILEMNSKTLLHFTTVKNSLKSMEKAIKNEVITDRPTDRPTDIVNSRVVCARLKLECSQN